MNTDKHTKVIIVTGSSGDLGKAISQELSKGNIIIQHYNSNKPDNIKYPFPVRTTRGEETHTTTIQADLRYLKGIDYLFAKTIERYGYISSLVNCIGINTENLIEMFDVNVLSVINCCEQAIALKAESIINISSRSAELGRNPVYASTKGAINSYTKALARISTAKINAISPGMCDTRANAGKQGNKTSPEQIADMTAWILESDFTGNIFTVEAA